MKIKQKKTKQGVYRWIKNYLYTEYGFMWIYVDVCGCMWMNVDGCGCIWMNVDVCG